MLLKNISPYSSPQFLTLGTLLRVKMPCEYFISLVLSTLNFENKFSTGQKSWAILIFLYLASKLEFVIDQYLMNLSRHLT